MKKLLKISGIVIGMLVLVFTVLILFRAQIGQALLGPPATFAAEDTPALPNYADLAFWASHPKLADTADLRLNAQPEPTDHPVDVFYVHPTTYFGGGGWNSNMDVSEAAAQTLETVLGGHGTIFSDCCNFYAPRYREAHIAVFRKPEDPDELALDNSFKALELAYGDVEAAFDVFLAERNPDRPFIIAGHSQGSLHAFRLMETRVDGTPLEEKMIAAYPVGFWFSADKLSRGPKSIGLCRTASETGCFVTWDTYGDAGSGRDTSGTITHWYKTGWEWTTGEQTLCVNPISWQADTEAAGKAAHKGAMPLPTTFDTVDLLLNRNSGRTYEALATPVAALTGAKCDPNGTLFIESQPEGVFASGIDERQMYHSFDWQLFYMDIKENVELRIAHYLENSR